MLDSGKMRDAKVRPCAKRVHNQMHGFYVSGTVPGVRDESEEGVLGRCYDEVYDLFRRLGLRCALDPEDQDILKLMDTLEHLLLESGIRMFEYGMKYAQEQK